VLDCVEDVHEPFSLHPLDGCAEGTEGTCATNTGTAGTYINALSMPMGELDRYVLLFKLF